MPEMGIGKLGNPQVILKRKFRYLLWIYLEQFGYIPGSYVKIASRPQLDIDEIELNYRNAVTWIPGKGRWQPLTVTFIDVANDWDMMPLYDWISSIYELREPQMLTQSEKSGWLGTGYLQMLDGCGSALETWELNNMWPQSINFGELDYSNSEEATIDITFRYSDVVYTNNCARSPVSICKGCYQ